MEIELKKIHEDQRGYIYLVKNLLSDDREFTFLETKKGFARGGCLHSKDENLVVIKGKIRYMFGDEEKIMSQGESTIIPAGVPHAWVALEDSILSEWGITSEEKGMDVKNPEMRKIIDEMNKKNSLI